MAQQTATHPTLIGTLWPGETAKHLRWAVLAIVGTALLPFAWRLVKRR